MITSDKQYEAAKEQLRMLEQSILIPTKKNVPKLIAQAAKRQIKELIDEIKINIDEYLKLIEGNVSSIKIDSLLYAPIRYRLATHMTIESFGQKVGVSPRQIARYEKEGYQNINTSTFKRILGNLKININGTIQKNDTKVHERKMG
jgi:DNA-binding transcriptional MerR regulator